MMADTAGKTTETAETVTTEEAVTDELTQLKQAAEEAETAAAAAKKAYATAKNTETWSRIKTAVKTWLSTWTPRGIKTAEIVILVLILIKVWG